MTKQNQWESEVTHTHFSVLYFAKEEKPCNFKINFIDSIRKFSST